MSTITSQTTINNRLTALIREKNDAIGSNDSTCIFTSAATLPNPPHPFLFPHSFTTFEHWHTHTHIARNHCMGVCAGTMLEVSSLLSALNAQTHVVAWPQSPPTQHHRRALLTRIRKVSLQKPREHNSSIFPASYCSKFFPTNPYSKEAPMGEKRLRQNARSGLSRFNVPLCCSTCNRTGVTNL